MIYVHCHAYKASCLLLSNALPLWGSAEQEKSGRKKEAITHLRKLNHEHVDSHINKPLCPRKTLAMENYINFNSISPVRDHRLIYFFFFFHSMCRPFRFNATTERRIGNENWID
jgi:hypothetical protein